MSLFLPDPFAESVLTNERGDPFRRILGVMASSPQYFLLQSRYMDRQCYDPDRHLHQLCNLFRVWLYENRKYLGSRDDALH